MSSTQENIRELKALSLAYTLSEQINDKALIMFQSNIFSNVFIDGYHLGLVATKPVFGVPNKASFKPQSPQLQSLARKLKFHL